MSCKDCFILSSSSYCVQWSWTILAILVESHQRNIPVELFWNLVFGRSSPKKLSSRITLKSGFWSTRTCHLKVSIFSTGSHFVQLSGRILATLVASHSSNISVKLFRNRSIGSRRRCRFFLFLAQAAILFSGAEQFSNFGSGSSQKHFRKMISETMSFKGFCIFSSGGHFFSNEERF